MGNEREVRRTAEHARILTSAGSDGDRRMLLERPRLRCHHEHDVEGVHYPESVDTKAVVQVGIKATSGAATATSNAIFGIQGTWEDDGDGVVNSADTFACMGIATSMLYVK